MKIAQVAPLFESVPPKGYGGTERVVSYLTEALMAQGIFRAAMNDARAALGEAPQRPAGPATL